MGLEEKRLRSYENAQRWAESLHRASNYLFLAVVLILLAGAAVGLIPELETSRQLQEKEALALARVEEAQAEYEVEQNRLDLLSSDVDYIEWSFRNSERRAAKPGEALILIPEERQEFYERAGAERASAGP